MRRWCVVIAGSLVVGAIASVLVAWALVGSAALEPLRSQLRSGRSASVGGAPRALWARYRPDAAPPDILQHEVDASFGRRIDTLGGATRRETADGRSQYWSGEQWLDRCPDDWIRDTGYWVEVRRAGWPCLCVIGATTHQTVFDGSWPIATNRDLLRVPIDDVRTALLPYRPTWGLLANSAIYGGALCMVYAVGRVTRRTWRRARERCPRCAYLVRDLARCPECGERAAGSRVA